MDLIADLEVRGGDGLVAPADDGRGPQGQDHVMSVRVVDCNRGRGCLGDAPLDLRQRRGRAGVAVTPAVSVEVSGEDDLSQNEHEDRETTRFHSLPPMKKGLTPQNKKRAEYALFLEQPICCCWKPYTKAAAESSAYSWPVRIRHILFRG